MQAHLRNTIRPAPGSPGYSFSSPVLKMALSYFFIAHFGPVNLKNKNGNTAIHFKNKSGSTALQC